MILTTKQRSKLIEILTEELNSEIEIYENSENKYLCEITKTAIQTDIKKIRRELLKLSKSLDL